MREGRGRAVQHLLVTTGAQQPTRGATHAGPTLARHAPPPARARHRDVPPRRRRHRNHQRGVPARSQGCSADDPQPTRTKRRVGVPPDVRGLSGRPRPWGPPRSVLSLLPQCCAMHSWKSSGQGGGYPAACDTGTNGYSVTEGGVVRMVRAAGSRLDALLFRGGGTRALSGIVYLHRYVALYTCMY